MRYHEKTPKEKLEALSVDALRMEVGILHGILVPDGYAWYSSDPRYPVEAVGADSRVLSKEMKPGVWVSLILDRNVGDHGPGWSWYISDKPGMSYWERGGGCLCRDAIKNAESVAAEDVYPPV